MTGTNASQVVLAVVLVAGLSALAAVRRRRQLLALSPALDPGSVRLEGSPFPRSLCGRYQQRAVEFRRPADAREILELMRTLAESAERA
jgi:hypothetical protein